MVIFLYGEDSFRSQAKLKELKEKFKKEVDSSSSSIAVLEGKEVDLAYIRKVVLAPALFARERFVVFKNFLASSPSEDLQKQTIELLKKYTGKRDDNIMVFWERAGERELLGKSGILFKFLKKQKFSQEFKPLTAAGLQKWIMNKVVSRKTKIDRKASQLLIELVGSDIWKLNNELEKLRAYRAGQEISFEDVRLLVAGVKDESVYYLLDLIAAKNSEGALAFLSNMLQSPDAAEAVFKILKWQANAIALIKGCLEDGLKNNSQIASQTGLHQFVVKKNKAYAERMSVAEVAKLLDRTIELEMAFRKQLSPPKVLLTDYLLDLTASD